MGGRWPDFALSSRGCAHGSRTGYQQTAAFSQDVNELVSGTVLVVGGAGEDTLHVRRTRSLATISLALLGLGGCRCEAGVSTNAQSGTPPVDAASPEASATGVSQREPLPGSPNVIIVLTDDQGYSDVGVFGAQGFTTPNLDRLAGEGIQLTSFYVGAPTCSPSRAALLTGSYPVRVGMTDVLWPGSTVGLNPRELTIADLLKSVGYATAAVGKWHLGDAKSFLPTRQGFDEYFGLPYSNDMTPLPLLENEDVVEYSPDLSQLTKRYTEKALDFITRNQQHLFFLYLAHTMPHVPIAASDDFKGKSAQGLYGDVIMEIDWSVGQILAKLDELGIANNTLVVFASDNGPWLLYGNHAGSARPLREGKFTTFEGGQRVPGIVRWPDRLGGDRVSNEVVTAMDLLPTLAAITGAELPTWTIDGRNVLPILEGAPGGADPPTTMYFYAGAELQAVRAGQWKLHLPHSYETVTEPGMDGEPGQGASRDIAMSLFDLDTDPGEMMDLWEQHPDVVSELMGAAAAFDADLKKNQRPPGQL
jgi:arylsulfatase A